MRNAFATDLVQAALRDERIVVLTGDHGYALFDEFRRVCPGQYINAGVAEQNMVGVAAGLAKGGLRPVVYGLSSFIPVRVLEQIKLDICYEGLPVVLIGDGAGVVYSTLGNSHQCAEDIAALRALPRMAILSPADAYEMHACMELAVATQGPLYLRIGKCDLGTVHTVPPKVASGSLCPVRAGDAEPAWIATGSMVQTALTAATHWPGSPVWSAPSLKPLSAKEVLAICGQHVVVVALEEHSIYGGLGSALAEIASAEAPTWICRIGIQDRFSQCAGSYRYLMEEHQLTPAAVVSQVKAFFAKLPAGDSIRQRLLRSAAA